LKQRENRTPYGYGGLVLLLAVGTFGQVYGQSRDADPLNVDLARCIDLPSDDERFACYQESVDKALAERGSSTQAPADAADAGSPSAPAPPATNAAEGDEIVATIAHLRETIPDVWIITLDNGQVWQMTRAQQYPLRVGLSVRLKSTRWGDSYRLTAPEHGGFVPVRRAL
jgi:hypothetical protein